MSLARPPVWAVSMVKDEADVIGHTVGNLLGHVDAVLVADNGSTDGTRDLLADIARAYPGTVMVTDDPDPAYYQSAKMSLLASVAAEQGARWVVPFDADEWWRSPWGRIGDVLLGLPPSESIAEAALYDHVTTDADDAAEGNPYRRIRWRRAEPGRFPKVAVRPVLPVVIEQGNHGAHYPRPGRTPQPVLEIHHFPYRSAEQFVRKARNGAAAYAATDLPESEGAHWRSYGATLAEHGPDALAAHYLRWFHSADPTADGLIEDPVA